MKRTILAAALMLAMGILAPAALADEAPDDELSDAQMWKAEMIADYFAPEDADESELADAVDAVVALRTGEPAVGWGALFKLLMYVDATGEDPTAIGPISEDGGGWAFGKLFKGLELDGEYKNFGQLQKAYKHGDSGEAGKSGKVPPGQAKKNG